MSGFFTYRGEMLHVEEVALSDIAAAVGTPFYCYSSTAVETAYRDFQAALADMDPLVCYALKANANLAVVRTLACQGAGADVVSEGEMRVALAAGVPAERIVFAGVGKTPEEMAAALDVGILEFNVESASELETLDRIAADRGRKAPIALRLNPDVDAETHEKVTTGKAENKFGIDFDLARKLARQAMEMPGIALEGLAVHIGSQLTGLGPFRAAFERVAALYAELQGAGVPLSRLDLGGGLGIAYHDESPPDVAAYAEVVRQATRGLDASLVFEPGRLMVGNAGVLVTKVLYVKDGRRNRFVVVDAAMNDLIRPTLYEAWHDIVPLRRPGPDAEALPVDVVGPICETGDYLARQRPLVPVGGGDLLAIRSTGAYSACMASTYNMRLPAPEVLVRGRDWATVRPRPAYEDLIARDRLPPWLDPAAEVSRGVA